MRARLLRAAFPLAMLILGVGLGYWLARRPIAPGPTPPAPPRLQDGGALVDAGVARDLATSVRRDGGLPGDGGTRPRPAPKPQTLEPMGELGILKGHLPRAADIIHGGGAVTRVDAGVGPEPLVEAAPVVAGTVPLSGVVQDERGVNLPSATVELLAAGRSRGSTLSDRGGHFRLAAPALAGLTLRVRHPRFAPLVQALPALDGGGAPPALQLRLSPGAGIEGELRDGRVGGVPVGAQLFLRLGGGERISLGLSRDGHFRRTALPPGEATLEAQAPGYAPLQRALTLPAAEHIDEVTVRDLRLEMNR